MISTAPRAVTFDYWNTLCFEPDLGERPRRVAHRWVEILAGAGVEIRVDEAERAYAAARAEYWDAWKANRQFRCEDASTLALEELDGRVPDDVPLRSRLRSAFHEVCRDVEVRPLAGVGDVLESLRSRGLRLGIVCDVGLMPSTYLREHLDRHDLLGFFDHWSFSDEVGVYKPDRRIFEHALGGLGGVAPGGTVHVGDRRRTDVAGAQALGMRAVRITDVFDDADPDEGPSGDAVVASHAELIDALQLS